MKQILEGNSRVQKGMDQIDRWMDGKDQKEIRSEEGERENLSYICLLLLLLHLQIEGWRSIDMRGNRRRCREAEEEQEIGAIIEKFGGKGEEMEPLESRSSFFSSLNGRHRQ